jgi:CheY-like chemotaxis protein
MRESEVPTSILIAEDDPDDRFLISEALREAELLNDVYFVEDGEALMDFLFHKDQYADPSLFPRPALILLDLNMPKKDGREALSEIKSNPDLRQIPIVALTTSTAEEDISRTYDLGVSGYITKPVHFTELVEVMKTLGQYWFDVVLLPSF